MWRCTEWCSAWCAQKATVSIGLEPGSLASRLHGWQNSTQMWFGGNAGALERWLGIMVIPWCLHSQTDSFSSYFCGKNSFMFQQVSRAANQNISELSFDVDTGPIIQLLRTKNTWTCHKAWQRAQCSERYLKRSERYWRTSVECARVRSLRILREAQSLGCILLTGQGGHSCRLDETRI